jgi:hypothetical protein
MTPAHNPKSAEAAEATHETPTGGSGDRRRRQVAVRTPTVRPLRIVGLLIAYVIVPLLLTEIALRVSALFPHRSKLYVVDGDVGYRLRPNVRVDGQTMNSAGYNDREWAVAPPDGVTRVAIIGDSFVYGIVARVENFTTQLQLIADREGSPVQILNMGIPSAEPETYLRVLESDCVRWNVDAAGIMLFVGNDVTQAHSDFETRIWFGSPHEVLRSPFLAGGSLEYSYAFRTARALLRWARERSNPSGGGRFSEGTFLSIERQRARVFAATPDRFVRRAYRESAEILQAMIERAKARGIGLFVVLAPDELQVNDDLRAALLADARVDPADYDFERPQRVLSEPLRRAGVPVLDLLRPLRARTSSESVYAVRDTHWSAYGNRVVAELLWDFLRDAGFLRPAGTETRGALAGPAPKDPGGGRID